jgi:transcriptional regulator with XRE-family HTH domain
VAPFFLCPEWLSSTSDTVRCCAAGTRSDGRSAARGGCQVSDRVSERRRAAALARHYREQENLTIAEIARRLGRAEATVKAYLYDPSHANKRPTDSPRANASLGATRAAYHAFPDHEVAPGLSTAELTPPSPGGTALRPIPAGARPYARALHARVRVAAPRAPLRYGTPRPTVPPVGWCLQRPRTLGRPSR